MKKIYFGLLKNAKKISISDAKKKEGSMLTNQLQGLIIRCMETGIFSCPQIYHYYDGHKQHLQKNHETTSFRVVFNLTLTLVSHPFFYKIPFFLIRFLSLFLISPLSACALSSLGYLTQVSPSSPLNPSPWQI